MKEQKGLTNDDSRTIAVRMLNKDVDKLEEVAKQMRLTKSDIVKAAITAYIYGAAAGVMDSPEAIKALVYSDLERNAEIASEAIYNMLESVKRDYINNHMNPYEMKGGKNESGKKS